MVGSLKEWKMLSTSYVSLSMSLSPPGCLPLSNHVWSLGTKRMHTTKQALLLKRPECTRQKAHSSWDLPEVWTECVWAQTHRLEQPLPPACHSPYLQASWGRLAVSRVLENLPSRSVSSVKSNFSVRNLPASWTTTKCLTLAGLYIPRPPRQQQKLYPEHFIRFLLQTWTSSWCSA